MHQSSDEPPRRWSAQPPAQPPDPESAGNGRRAAVQTARSTWLDGAGPGLDGAGSGELLADPLGELPKDPLAGVLAVTWAEPDGQRIRDQWLEVQLSFLDAPRSAADRAERLVDETVASITWSLRERRDHLHERRVASGTDTERLRAALRDYRDLLDRVLGL